MNTARQSVVTRDVALRHRAKWLATAGLALSLTIPLSASAGHDGDAAINLLVGATVAYALIDAVDGFDDDRNRRHGGGHRRKHRSARHDDAHRYFRGGYRHGDYRWRHYLHQERHHQARHHRGHALRHGYRHAYEHQPRTYAPHWYAHR